MYTVNKFWNCYDNWNDTIGPIWTDDFQLLSTLFPPQFINMVRLRFGLTQLALSDFQNWFLEIHDYKSTKFKL